MSVEDSGLEAIRKSAEPETQGSKSEYVLKTTIKSSEIGMSEENPLYIQSVAGDAASIQGVEVNNTAPTDGQTLVYDSGTEQYTPSTVAASNTDKTFFSSAIDTVALTLKKIAGQTARLFRLTDESDNVLMGIDENGTIELRESANSGDLSVIRKDATDQGLSFTGSSGNRAFRFASDSYVYDFDKNGITSYSGNNTIRLNGNGNAGNPSYRWRGDSNTGMYNPSGDTIGFSCGGTERVQVNTQALECNSVLFKPGHYATGSLPSASSYEGHIAYDTTTQQMKYSDGTSWVAM